MIDGPSLDNGFAADIQSLATRALSDDGFAIKVFEFQNGQREERVQLSRLSNGTIFLHFKLDTVVGQIEFDPVTNKIIANPERERFVTHANEILAALKETPAIKGLASVSYSTDNQMVAIGMEKLLFPVLDIRTRKEILASMPDLRVKEVGGQDPFYIDSYIAPNRNNFVIHIGLSSDIGEGDTWYRVTVERSGMFRFFGEPDGRRVTAVSSDKIPALQRLTDRILLNWYQQETTFPDLDKLFF